MSKITFTVPASKTPQTVSFDLQDTVVPTISGTTPLDPVVPPPVVDPPPVVTPPATPYSIVYSNGYDKDSDLDHAHLQLGKGVVSTTVTKNSAGSFKSIVNVGDQPISSGFRSENQYDSSLTLPEGAVDFDINFEKWESPGWGGCCIQWHPGNNDNGGSALLFMEVAQKNWNVYFWGKGYQDSYSKVTPINPNQWYHLRFETKWTRDNTGYIRVFIDGNLYWSYTGQTLISSDIPYVKDGQNNWANNAKTAPHGMTLYIDNFVISKKN